jgi:hypothetical protein
VQALYSRDAQGASNIDDLVRDTGVAAPPAARKCCA